MLGRLTWLDATLYAALLRSLTFVGAAVAILLCYRALELADESWAITSVALVMQTQARASLRVAVIRVFINVFSATCSCCIWAAHDTEFCCCTLAGWAVLLPYQLDDGVRSAYICVASVIGADRLAVLSPPIESAWQPLQSVQRWA
jgi:hypothetical protein